jgi:hypothetical protein
VNHQKPRIVAASSFSGLSHRVVDVQVVFLKGRTHGAQKQVAVDGLGDQGSECSSLDLGQTTGRADRDAGNGLIGQGLEQLFYVAVTDFIDIECNQVNGLHVQAFDGCAC